MEVKGNYIFHTGDSPSCSNCKNWEQCEIKGSFGRCYKGLFRGKHWCQEDQPITTYFSNICNEWEAE